MEVSEDAGEPNKDFNSSTSENQQTNAPTPCQASLPAGDKAAGQPVPRRFPRVQRTVLRRTRRRRRPRRRRRKPSRKILRTFARDGRKPSLEDGHPLNVEPSTSDPDQEGVTPSTSVSTSD
nr:uncharacterized protein LOC121825746 [Peromyscus maniculatus bairdii]